MHTHTWPSNLRNLKYWYLHKILLHWGYAINQYRLFSKPKLLQLHPCPHCARLFRAPVGLRSYLRTRHAWSHAHLHSWRRRIINYYPYSFFPHAVSDWNQLPRDTFSAIKSSCHLAAYNAILTSISLALLLSPASVTLFIFCFFSHFSNHPLFLSLHTDTAYKHMVLWQTVINLKPELRAKSTCMCMCKCMCMNLRCCCGMKSVLTHTYTKEPL